MAKNPLNDDLYDGNDEQIDDLKEALKKAHSLLREVAEILLHGGVTLYADEHEFNNLRSRIIAHVDEHTPASRFRPRKWGPCSSK